MSATMNDEQERLDTIGQRIRSARKAVGFNQEGLATRIGVTQPTIANWEADVHNPRQAMVRKLAAALEVTQGWLAGGESGDAARAGPDAASSYLRRPLVHVPVVPAAALAARMRFSPAEAARLAVDFLPLAASGGPFFAVSGLDLDPSLPGTTDTLAVIDGGVISLQPGTPCLVPTALGLRLIDDPADMEAPPWGSLVQIVHQY